jgi:DNA-binding response OmpR family regulator
MPVGSILVVEDEADIRSVIGEILEIYDYSAVMAGDGQQAWEITRTRNFDLLVTDLGIPGINGLELAQKIRAGGSAMPIMIITGVSFEAANAELKKLAPCELLMKPFRIDDFARVMTALLGKGRKEKPKIGISK